MCLFNLQKAFDSVEFAVLLSHVFDTDVNGKMWRLIRNWYQNGRGFVQIDGRMSPVFPVERGVRQGSILSPTLFNIVMDPLLRSMEAANIGLSVNNFYGGAYLHADDIRTIANSKESLEVQVNEVVKFSNSNFLQLNAAKCEIVSFSMSNPVVSPDISLNGSLLPASGTAKCLGYQWNHDLSAKPSVEHNILKARRSFFAYGSMGVFQSNLSPLSGRSVVETCVLPVLLYGSENWCLTNQSTEKLDSFIGELSKRLLKFPKWFSNLSASIICGFNSASCLCLCRKLRFLRKILSSGGKCPISSETLKALSDDSDSICLIRECRQLELAYDTDFTSLLLDPNSEHPYSTVMKKSLQSRDRELRLQTLEERADMETIVNVERAVGWLKLWDLALENGQRCTDGIKHLARVLVYPTHASKVCPLCDTESLQNASLLDHVLKEHSCLSLTGEQLLSSLLKVSDSDSSFFVHINSLSRLF